ncbi:MAG TPA: hypothetical protein VH419_12795 [Nocardioidaceae bacterium]|jgi:hypothetical protein
MTRVLLIGFDPAAVPGQDAAAVSPACEHARRRALCKPEPVLEYFEYVVNLVHVAAPTSAIAFNSSPADTVEAALRALNVHEALPRVRRSPPG